MTQTTDSDDPYSHPNLTAVHRWFWAPTLDDLEAQIKYDIGRRHFLKAPDDTDNVLHIGNIIPEDVTDDAEDAEPTLRFNNLIYHTAPLFTGHGYYVTRLPPRPMLAQEWRETVEGDGVSEPHHTTRNRSDDAE